MQRKQCGKITYRIVGGEDMQAIASFLEGLAQKEGGQCTFEANFRDNTCLLCEHASEWTSCFPKKKCESVQFKYKSNDSTRYIRVILEETCMFEKYGNEFELFSSDDTWFHDVRARLSDILDGMQKRSWICRMFFNPWLMLISSIPFLFSIVLAMSSLPGFEYGAWLEEGSFPFFPFSIVVLFSISLYAVLLISLRWLFPKIEFAFATHQYNQRVRMRHAAMWICSTMIIPVLLNWLIN